MRQNDDCQSGTDNKDNVMIFCFKIPIKTIHEIITDVTQYYLSDPSASNRGTDYVSLRKTKQIKDTKQNNSK